MTAVRLQKYLADCGVASRRASEKLIAEGRVTINGEVAALGASVEPGVDAIVLDNKPVSLDRKVYVVLNKPVGTVTTASDTHGRPTILECVQGVGARVFPVGRLDMDVEGVLLLTNDGELAHRLIHPKFEVHKVYLVWVEGRMTPETAIRLEQGVLLEDGLTAPCKCVILNQGKEVTQIELTLHEGRKREVKRMCAAVGHRVRKLLRLSFANVKARGLRPGEWRYLSDAEVKGLKKLAGLK